MIKVDFTLDVPKVIFANAGESEGTMLKLQSWDE